MSNTYSICCVQCAKALWVGQSTERTTYKWFMYLGQERTMILLQKFLMQHKGHHLVFDDDWRVADLETDVGKTVEYLNEENS